jgi:hypothetical protein
MPDRKMHGQKCAQQLYARFYGQWRARHRSYRWQSRSDAARPCGLPVPPNLHRAVGEAELTRQGSRYIAAAGEGIHG